ncbi:sporulation YhaL family protein [Alkalicoccobacillus plakortidis]|uniref:Sporulation YhaL family protein n=1 Tax=Alkalicoccobacillus plakortidis TaxID=444060 RepID=A0ABT0XN54_9BACI|nr:sporulation YhaL family protein [Alkalicoccobacillus plakortidis]MCM2676679.1 sporulation YhaL family protein [Alkalicoccobacillus plakortidis]
MTDQLKQKLAVAFLAILVIVFITTQTNLLSVVAQDPWWVYLVMLGVLISGYLSIKYLLEDRRQEQAWIEQEGHVFMERLEEARLKKESKS